MPSFLPAFFYLLTLWLLPACPARAGPFEECNLGEDFDFSPSWRADHLDRISSGCNGFIKQAPANTRKLAVAYTNRGNAHTVALEREKAIAHYTKAIEIDPLETLDKRTAGHQHAHVWRLRANAEKGDHDYAIAEFTKMIKASPGYAVVYSERARVYFRTGRTSQALADAEQAMGLVESWLKRDPGAAFALDVRGHVYETLRKPDEAIADYRKALKLNPSQAMWSEYRLRRLGRCLDRPSLQME